MRRWLNVIQTPWFSGFCVSEPPSLWCHNISRLCRLSDCSRCATMLAGDLDFLLGMAKHTWEHIFLIETETIWLVFLSEGRNCCWHSPFFTAAKLFWVCFSCQAAINPNLCGMRVWGRRSYRSLLMSPADTTTTTPPRETTIYYGCHRVRPPSFYIARLLPECPSLLVHQRHKPSMKVMQVQVSRSALDTTLEVLRRFCPYASR